MPHALSVGVPYGVFWTLNPNTLAPFFSAYNLKMSRENESKISEIDIAAWNIGLYVRSAIVAAFGGGKYPTEPASVQQSKPALTSKEQADEFREFMRRYKRPGRKGGET